MENWLFYTVCGILVFFTGIGYHKGFIKLSVTMVSLVITIIIVRIASPYVSGFLKESTPLYESLKETLVEASGWERLPEGEIPITTQTQLIEGLEIPESLKRALIENNNYEIYEILGVQRFSEYVSSYIANIIINAISFLLAFIIVYAVFNIGIMALDIVSRLPVIRGVNKLAGALLGLGQGLIFIWLLCLVVTAFGSTSWGREILGQIEENAFLSFFYTNNIFTRFILTLVSNLI